jgi:hypothetical protein
VETPFDNTNLSRRAVLGGLGAGLVGAGLLASGSASAAPTASGVMQQAHPSAPSAFPQVTAPTALKPELRYVLHCGYDFLPIDSAQTWSTNGGSFHFNGASSGYCGVLAHLPVGSVIKELELYGSRPAAGVVGLYLWDVNMTTGNISNPASINSPTVAGDFTLTLPVDSTQSATSKARPFVFIDGVAAPGTSIYGLRVGYVSPTGFIALPTAINPRVLDTRAGGTKLQPNEERTITLPVPGGVAAVLTLTATQTVGGGFISVFQSGITWPGNSSINFVEPNQSIANTVITAVSADSKIIIRGGQSATDVIIDVAGWIA